MSMRRNIFNLSVALMTFCAGLGAEKAFERYLEVALPQPINLAVPLEKKEQATQLPPGSLPAELQRIDEKYRQRCQLPTDWNGELPTIIQLERFGVCNDEWAKVRREAIRNEMTKYFVQY